MKVTGKFIVAVFMCNTLMIIWSVCVRVGGGENRNHPQTPYLPLVFPIYRFFVN